MLGGIAGHSERLGGSERSLKRESLKRESLNAIVMSSHHTVPASELKRCSASTAVAPETKETPSATTWERVRAAFGDHG